MKLNKEYKFDNFEINQGNKLAFNLSLTVAKQPGKKYLPFFISGNKKDRVHLMSAIANYIAEQFNYNIGYANGNDISKITKDIDVLIIDELECLPNSEEPELLEIIKVLQSNNKQIVLGSAKTLEELNNISDKLKNIISWGMAINIESNNNKTNNTKIPDYNWLE